MGAGNGVAKSPAPEGGGTEAPIAQPRPASQPPPRRSERPSARPGGPESLVGKMLSGRYRIERLLGEGGMGAVYQAEHTHMRKRLAVKVLHPEMSRMPEVVARFEREAMAAAHIDHPNVAAATDFGKLDDGSFFLVLEYVEGKSLREALESGPLELGRALHITMQIAAALARAHALGIVHRDLKPENVMLIGRDEDKDFVKVLDFGIAKVPVGELASSPATSAHAVLTQLGMVYGTPEYMAPEQALGQPVDGRADLYSVGVMAFEMLSGVRPFEHESKVTLLGMHVTAPIPSIASKAPEGVEVPPEVEGIVSRLLAKEASQRFADAKELSAALAATMTSLVESGRIDASVLDRTTSSGVLRTGLPGPASSRASLGSLPIVTGPSAPISLRAKTYAAGAITLARVYAGKVSPRTWAASGGALGALVLLILFIMVLSDRPGTTEKSAASVRGEVVATKPAKTPPRDRALDDLIAGAQASIDRADYAGAIAQLTPAESAHQDRPDIHRLLERAYASTGDVKNAVSEADAWLKTEPAAAADAHLGEDMQNLAEGREEAEAAFALLETSMGASGADILYDIAYGPTHTPASARARSALAAPSVHAHASPALAVTLDLRAAAACDAKKTLLARARDVGDARTLAVLHGYQPTSGCGFLGMHDCWPCMHRDGSLAAAIAAITLRVGRP